ncbi:hypothetical protein D3C84_1238440 [compost metagenome]
MRVMGNARTASTAAYLTPATERRIKVKIALKRARTDMPLRYLPTEAMIVSEISANDSLRDAGTSA